MNVQKILPVALAFVLTACGGGDEHPLPPNAELKIAPGSIQWEINPRGADCIVDESYYVDQYVNIAAVNENGAPMGRVDLNIALDLSDGTFSKQALMGLYNDANGDGAVQDSELVSDENQGVYTTRTDEYDGNKIVMVRVNLSCPYRGMLNVYSGAASASMSIEVKEKEQ